MTKNDLNGKHPMMQLRYWRERYAAKQRHHPQGKMTITRQSMISGEIRTRELNVTQEQLDDYYDRGMLAQEAFPHLSDDDRVFVRTGNTDEDWQLQAEMESMQPLPSYLMPLDALLGLLFREAKQEPHHHRRDSNDPFGECPVCEATLQELKREILRERGPTSEGGGN